MWLSLAVWLGKLVSYSVMFSKNLIFVVVCLFVCYFDVQGLLEQLPIVLLSMHFRYKFDLTLYKP